LANPENLIPAKPGEVRNPNGRPKGALGRSAIVRRWLEADGDALGTTVADDLVLAAIKKAKDGDISAFKELFDSGFGKLTEKTDMNVKAEVNTDVTAKLLAKYPTEALEEILDDATNND